MKLTATVGNYTPRTYEFDTDSPSEALAQLAARFKTYEGTRNPWPSEAYPLRVEFHEGT